MAAPSAPPSRSPSEPGASSPSAGPDLDDLDRRLLDALQRDAGLSNLALARRVHTSPPTCLRRVRRLRELGLIAREVAILAPEAFGPRLSAIIEITLDTQAEDKQLAFAARIDDDSAIVQSYRVSPGPDFVLIAQVAHMAGYQALASRLFGVGSNVRNVRTFFVVARTKYETALPLPQRSRPDGAGRPSSPPSSASPSSATSASPSSPSSPAPSPDPAATARRPAIDGGSR